MTLLPITRAFLRDWLDWVERGAPERDPYFRRVGLCGNASLFEEERYYYKIWNDLTKYFKATEENSVYPFGEEEYDQRYLASTQHLDPKRLAFVRAHCEQDSPITNEEK